MFSLHYSLFHKTVSKRKQEVFTLLPTIVFDHVGQLDNKFSSFIFLTAFKHMFAFPPECGFAVLTVDVCTAGRPARRTLLCGATAHVHHRIEEVGASLTSLKGLGDQLLVIGQVGSAVDTAVW